MSAASPPPPPPLPKALTKAGDNSNSKSKSTSSSSKASGASELAAKLEERQLLAANRAIVTIVPVPVPPAHFAHKQCTSSWLFGI